MRGYVLSLLVVFLFYALLMFTYNVVAIKHVYVGAISNVFFAEKAAYLVDDVSADIRPVLGLDTPANSTLLIFAENFTIVRSTFFSNYVQFLANYSAVANANMSASYSDPLNITFSNGFVYRTNFATNRTDFFNASGGAAAVAAYEANITTNETRSGLSLPAWTANGTFVRVNYIDSTNPNKNFVESGFVNPNILNTMDIKFGAGQSVLLRFGLIEGRPNSYRMEQVAIFTATSHALTVNRTTKDAIYAYYNVPLNVTIAGARFDGSVPAN